MNPASGSTSRSTRFIVAALLAATLIGGVTMLADDRAMPHGDQRGAQKPEVDGVEIQDLDARLDRLAPDVSIESPRPGSASPDTSSALPPTPPPDLSFAEAKDALLERAEAGDADAACRFGAELLLCSNDTGFTTMTMEGLSSFIADEDPERQEVLVTGAGLTLATNDAAVAHCAGLDRASLASLHDRLERLIQRGSVRARVLYALQSPGGGLARALGRPGFTLQPSARQPVTQFYADNAGEFLRQGIASRDPLAIEGMILLHAPQRAMGAHALPMWLPNPARFVAYVGLWEALGLAPLGADFQTMRDRAWSSLDVATQSRIRELIQDESRRWRAGARGIDPAPTFDVDTIADLCGIR